VNRLAFWAIITGAYTPEELAALRAWVAELERLTKKGRGVRA
jgi:hypothetical protein